MKFSPGQIVCTRTALATCKEKEINPMWLVSRHLAGDWGDLGKEDKQTNEDAVQHGERILSMYQLKGEKFYVITEWDRSATTVMLAEDY